MIFPVSEEKNDDEEFETVRSADSRASIG